MTGQLSTKSQQLPAFSRTAEHPDGYRGSPDDEEEGLTASGYGKSEECVSKGCWATAGRSAWFTGGNVFRMHEFIFH